MSSSCKCLPKTIRQNCIVSGRKPPYIVVILWLLGAWWLIHTEDVQERGAGIFPVDGDALRLGFALLCVRARACTHTHTHTHTHTPNTSFHCEVSWHPCVPSVNWLVSRDLLFLSGGNCVMETWMIPTIQKCTVWIGRIAQWIKGFGAKPDDLSLVMWNLHERGKELSLASCPQTSTYAPGHACT
jgi:hypothetical protein